jgi:hypothetical protein
MVKIFSVYEKCAKEIQGHKADGTHHVYVPSKKGLFFSDVKIDVAHFLSSKVDRNKIK